MTPSSVGLYTSKNVINIFSGFGLYSSSVVKFCRLSHAHRIQRRHSQGGPPADCFGQRINHHSLFVCVPAFAEHNQIGCGCVRPWPHDRVSFFFLLFILQQAQVIVRWLVAHPIETACGSQCYGGYNARISPIFTSVWSVVHCRSSDLCVHARLRLHKTHISPVSVFCLAYISPSSAPKRRSPSRNR